MEIGKAVLGWPVVRQLTGNDKLGRGTAAFSSEPRKVARTETADSAPRARPASST